MRFLESFSRSPWKILRRVFPCTLLGRGRCAKALPKKLNPSTVTMIASPERWRSTTRPAFLRGPSASMAPHSGVGAGRRDQEAQGRGPQDRHAGGKSGVGDDRPDRVGQNMVNHDPQMAQPTARAASTKVRSFADRTRANQAGVIPPADSSHGNDDILHPAAQKAGDGDGQDNGGNGEDDIRETHDHGLGYPAVVSRGQAEGYADKQLNSDHADPDDQGVTAPVDNPGEHVPPVPVRAQGMLPGGGGEHFIQVLFDGIVRSQERRQDGGAHEGKEDRQADKGGPVAPERRKTIFR